MRINTFEKKLSIWWCKDARKIYKKDKSIFKLVSLQNNSLVLSLLTSRSQSKSFYLCRIIPSEGIDFIPCCGFLITQKARKKPFISTYLDIQAHSSSALPDVFFDRSVNENFLPEAD